MIVQHGDRFILRFYSPMETLGGGMVLNPHPRRHKQKTMEESLKNLAVLEKGSLDERLALLISGRGLAGMEEAEVIGAVAADKPDIASALAVAFPEEDRAARRQPSTSMPPISARWSRRSSTS